MLINYYYYILLKSCLKIFKQKYLHCIYEIKEIKYKCKLCHNLLILLFSRIFLIERVASVTHYSFLTVNCYEIF